MTKNKLLCLLVAAGMILGCVNGLGAAAPRPELTLVENGAPRAGIVIDGNKPTRSAQFAAFELQHVIKLMTGAELPIVSRLEDVKGIPILVGESEATKKIGVVEGLKGEEYLVSFADNKIVLMGNDSPDYGKVVYSDIKTFPKLEYSFRGTTFAVYDFLEKCCGVRFYSFGDDGIAMNNRTTLSVKPISIRTAPKMDAQRWPNLSCAAFSRDETLLMMRWRASLIFGMANHNVWSLFYRYWGKSKSFPDIFVEKRPEYFAKGYAGASAPNAIRQWQYPGDADLPPQICTSHPGPVQYFAEEAFKVYQGEKVVGGYSNSVKKMPGNPFYYPMQEDDNELWCKCEKCRNSFSNVSPEARYAYQHFDWVNRIAEAAAKLNPEIGIATLAYGDTLPRPDLKILKLHPHVSVKLCMSVQSWYLPLVYSENHKIYKDWIENEGSKRPITLWTYMLCPAWEAQKVYKYKKFFPMMYPWRVGRIFKEFAKDGIRGVFIDMDPGFYLLEAYVANKVCFDPSVDTDKLVDEYFTMYYGAAAEPMRRFCKTVEDITWNPDNYPEEAVKKPFKYGGSFVYGIHTEKTNWHLGTPERMAELQKLVDEAQKLASSPIEQKRVKWFVDNIWTQAVEGRKAFEKRQKVQANLSPRISTDYAGECGGDPQKVDFSQVAKMSWFPIDIDNPSIGSKPELSVSSDSKWFYIRFHENGDAAFKNSKADLWMNNVEIFLAARPGYPYGHLALSPGGEFKALKHQVVNGVTRMDDWSLEPVIKNQLDENGWTFLMAIPLARLLPDKAVEPKGSIYANFMRTRSFAGGKSCSWSPIFTPVYADGIDMMGMIYIAPANSSEGSLRINGEFKPDFSGSLPEGWTQNKLPNLEPHGVITLKDGRVTISSKGKEVYLHTKDIFPVRRGDQVVFEFTAKGKGDGAVGAYLFDTEYYNFLGWFPKEFMVSEEPKNYKISLLVKNTANNAAGGFRPVMTVSADSEVEYSNLKVTVIPRGKQP